MEWERHTAGADSPYPEDRRVKYVSGEYEITKEGDGCYWLRHEKKPLGKGPRLRDAMAAAERHHSGLRPGQQDPRD
jgi:hypothetical protein